MSKKLECILLVDDDDATNFINKRLIELAGVTNHIKVAENGVEALKYIQKSLLEEHAEEFPQPDLILLDINMPKMNGWEFLGEYKKLPKGEKKRIMVVMLTTSLNPDDLTKSEEIKEVDAFRNKPLTQEMIAELMERYFSTP